MRLQSQPSIPPGLGPLDTNTAIARNPTLYSGPLDCFRKSLASGGIRSLYRGISAPLFGAAVETSSLFFSYRIAQEAVCAIVYPEARKRNEDGNKITLPLSALLFCGAASGAFTSLLLTPIELVKCQMQAGASSSGASVGYAYKNPLTVISSIWRHQGLVGFWRGQMGTLIRETGGSAAWFGSYEGMSAFLKEWSGIPGSSPVHEAASSDNTLLPTEQQPSTTVPVWHQLLSGAMAGIAYNFLFYPADTIKSRMQTEAVIESSATGPPKSGLSPRLSFWLVGRELWREQGIKGMYRGCGITVARSGPASAIIFAVWEALRSRFD